MAQMTSGTAVQRHGGNRLVKPEKSERPVKKPANRTVIVLGAVAAVLVAACGAYLGLCAYASGRDTIWPGTRVLGQDIGGLTVEQAAEKLNAVFPQLTVDLYLYDKDGPPSEHEGKPDGSIPVSDLGTDLDAQAIAQSAYDLNAAEPSFLSQGWRYLTGKGVAKYEPVVHVDPRQEVAAAAEAAEALSIPAQDASYTLEGTSLLVTMPVDGRSVSAPDLRERLDTVFTDSAGLTLDVPYSVDKAEELTAQEIHDAIYGEMKNASYDAATGTIVPEQGGADFDIPAAQAAMDAAAPGATVRLEAKIEEPAITAKQLEAVLFRDVLGEARTKVSGTAARISNVKLASSAINGAVLNSGELFSYNDTVGQRTTARGYKAAPAYVNGLTVDEIGGGVCQPSSTLYLACLRSNMEITDRSAHRYVPSYISPGMDATVSWGGPDYKFTNNTDYPVKIRAVYGSDGYLTVQLLGTNVDGTRVEITNEHLSTTPWETVYKEDASLAPGEQVVSVTPYTGYRYRTYRNIYDTSGKLISSEYEATSDYKVRNRVILRNPEDAAAIAAGTLDPDATAAAPSESTATTAGTGSTTGAGDTPDTPLPTVDPSTQSPDDTPSEPSEPAESTAPVEPAEPATDWGFTTVTAPEEEI